MKIFLYSWEEAQKDKAKKKSFKENQAFLLKA